MTSFGSDSLVPARRRRARLLWGASLATLVAAGAGAGVRAQSLGALMAATHQAAALSTTVAAPPAGAASSGLSTMAQAGARALQYKTQAASAVSLAQQAQAAAAKTAQALAAASGAPDGLAVGGLQAVTHPVLAAADTPQGLNTWQGAMAPTQAGNVVTVVQTAPRAVLDWISFNVGANTKLTFQQQLNKVDQPSWVVLNRVVGDGVSPMSIQKAEILGSISAPGTVLVLDQNGILFGGSAQVNVGSLIASTLEIGHATETSLTTNVISEIDVGQRNEEFLNYGLLGFAEQNPSGAYTTFSELATVSGATAGQQTVTYKVNTASVQVDPGASLASADGGYVMLLAPTVINHGYLSSPDGEVALQSGGAVTLLASEGSATSPDPDVRGLVVTGSVNAGDAADSVVNGCVSAAVCGLIDVPRGYVSLGASPQGGVIDAGMISATTSVSENGYVNLFGASVDVQPGAVISIGPDLSTSATIPQDQTSLSAFKPSRLRIGLYTPGLADAATGGFMAQTQGGTITLETGSLLYAPSANISIGADAGAAPVAATATQAASVVTVQDGAVIDAAGLADVVIPASRNSIEIDPVKGNELADSPAFRNGFLNGATVYLDPRLSGVNADGVAWVGSPLIAAAAYAQQVGISVSELMVAGGNVTLGAPATPAGQSLTAASQASQVNVAQGAVIDISGGWKTYQAGQVVQSYLVDASGEVIPISQANPDDTYVAVYQGYTVDQARWGVSQTYVNPVLTGAKYEGQYTEGQDAGSLTLTGSVIALNGQVYAGAYPGAEQILSATPGTSASAISGDLRALQAAPSQLPAGGYLDIQSVGLVNNTGGADIVIAPSTPPNPGGPATTTTLYADALTGMGLSQLTLSTSGAITVNGDVTLAAGGAFEALAGRAITVNGVIAVPSGSIDMTTADLGGSVFEAPSSALAPGSFDITINGGLNVAGRWVNDFNAAAGQLVGSAYLGGGEITLDAAPRITGDGQDTPVSTAAFAVAATDVSGSILINPGALLNASGGGYVNPTGGFILSAKGGSVSLYDDTTYFEVAEDPAASPPTPGGLPGFRLDGLTYAGQDYIPVNPGAVAARVSIASGAIEDQGFGGGGTFTLTTPAFAFGAAPAATGTALPLDFFSAAGFASYKITAYQTAILPNYATAANSACLSGCNGYFDNGLGGYNAVLATDIATVAAGQTLNLTQSYLSPQLNPAQIAALQGLPTGSSLISAIYGHGNSSLIVPASVPADAWDQKPVNLTLGGLIELDVAAGGQVTGAPGVNLTVGELYNAGADAAAGLAGGLIRLPGGTITQSLIMPPAYGDLQAPIGVNDLSQVFSTAANGAIDENAASLVPAAGGGFLTNAQVAATYPIYLLGDLPAGQGVRLGQGSVTDLSGTVVINPRAEPQGNLTIASFTDGTVVAGGSLISTEVFPTSGSLFHATYGASAYSQLTTTTPAGLAETLVADAGSTINLSGAQATFDRPTIPVDPPVGTEQTSPAVSYAPTLEWSNAGSLTLGSGGSITGAVITAQGGGVGGSAEAQGGTLTVLNPVLYQGGSAPDLPGATLIAADQVMYADFATFVAEGSLGTSGSVKLKLSRSFFVETPPTYQTAGFGTGASLSIAYSPRISVGGRLEIDAPYIALDGAFQTLTAPLENAPIHEYEVFLNAQSIDVTGAVLFDRTVERVSLDATGDVRLIGVTPSLVGLDAAPSPSLAGQLEADGNITIDAAQVYPTTGTNFAITSTENGGVIQIKSPGGAAPATPYSAGGSLLIQATTIEQDGVVRVPLGSLTLGSNSALNTFGYTDYAHPTDSVTLGPGSITSVSADGLSIPYGTTTDQVEWYFTPDFANPLTSPPAGKLTLAGAAVNVQAGATVDLNGGGDVYAYEFISGPGGTRDVLDQYNSDPLSSNNGCQYADCRQVYAIVPGLSSAAVAALDPIYSTNYASLYGPSQAGLSVYLNAAPAVGLAAGWYTLLPAQYALLPGGLRVVQDTSVATPPPLGGVSLSDGTVATSGYFGVAGTSLRGSALDVFDIQSRALINTESDIALTHGNVTFAADAAKNGTYTPQLPIDAGQLVLSPLTGLTLDGAFETTPGQSSAGVNGRGSDVDIGGTTVVIEAAGSAGAATPAGTIALTDASLDALNASSLFIGGARTDNADGTTSLDVTTGSLTVNSGVKLAAPEILLATDGAGASLTIDDGASITASGAVTGEPGGNYVINGISGSLQVQGAQGAFVRVSDGPARLLTRLNIDPTLAAGTLGIGAATLSTEQGAASLPNGAIDLDSLGALNLSGSATITTNALAVAAGDIALGASAPKGAPDGTLVITPSLQTLFGAAQSLTLRSQNPITFAPGAYGFGNLTLNTPGLALDTSAPPVAGVADVSLTLGSGDSLTLANSSPALPHCLAAACGAGALTLSATSIAFGGGTIETFGFGGGVTLTAPTILVGNGVATLDAGSAPLALNTRFLGDAGTGAAGATIPSLTLATTGAVVIAGAAPASTFTAPAGTPGASLAISGASVAIQGTELRATAGSLAITAAGGITLAGGALLETPAYYQSFGDAADPQVEWAPGGSLSLTALNGDIAISADSRLFIGYDAGALPAGVTAGSAGALSLIAQNGSVFVTGSAGAPTDLASVISTGGLGGASLTLDSGAGGFDLSAFAAAAGVGANFGGGISVRTGAGDLTLAAGDTLTAAGVSLTADDTAAGNGLVTIGGVIDTSGINGGAVSLYGAGGVTLASGAMIDARALGYGSTATPTLQAKGGAVTIGVEGSGAITIAPGATIDVSAANPDARLVAMDRTSGADYTYVPGDLGGVVTFRAPVVGGTVNVSMQGAVTGASAVDLLAVRQWNLADLNQASGYVGVTTYSSAAAASPTLTALGCSGTASCAVLNLGASGGINALGVEVDASGAPVLDAQGAPIYGPIAGFIQTFDKTVAIPAGLSSLANFQAQPGVELDYAGDIVLASNWNLGAGVLKGALNPQNAAVQAGLLVEDKALETASQPYVLALAPPPADPDPNATAAARTQYAAAMLAQEEGALLTSPYMTAIYRVGGSFAGAPGALTLRAGGNLTLNGSVTDGFFQFADQTDPGYLNAVLKVTTNQGVLSTSCVGAVGCQATPPWAPTVSPSNYVDIVLPAADSLTTIATPLVAGAAEAPYSALANAPAAQGSLAGGTGDPLGSAQLFPLLPTGQAVSSWSYQLVAGVGTDASGLFAKASANPLATAVGAGGGVTVQGYHVYSYGADAFATANSLELAFNGADYTAPAWLAALESQYSKLKAGSYTIIDPTIAPITVRLALPTLMELFAKAHPNDSYSFLPDGKLGMPLASAADFMTFLSANFAAASVPSPYVVIDTTSASQAVQQALPALLKAFAKADPQDLYGLASDGGLTLSPTGATDFTAFLASRNIDANFTSQTFSATSLAAAYDPSIQSNPTYAVAPTLVRTGNGAISVAASGDIDLSNDKVLAGYVGPTNLNAAGQIVAVTDGGLQLGGAAIYTAGQIAPLGETSVGGLQVNLDANLAASDAALTNTTYLYGVDRSGFAGILVADPVYAQGGGDVTLSAGGDILSRRDTVLEGELGNVGGVPAITQNTSPWIGFGDQPWRTGAIGVVVNAQIDPQLFQEGVGTLGGGDISITAGRNISDLSIVATDSLATASVGPAQQPTGEALAALGGGNISVLAGGDLLGGRLDVAAGDATVRALGAVVSAGVVTYVEGLGTSSLDNALRVRVSDGQVAIDSGGAADLQGVAALGVTNNGPSTAAYDSAGFYGAGAGVSILADGPVSIANAGFDVTSQTLNQQTPAVYPGSFSAVSFTGALNISTASAQSAPATEVLLYPDPTGTLTLLAAGDIGSTTAAGVIPTVIAQLDSDPTLLPGAFSDFLYESGVGVSGGLGFAFPAVLPSTPDVLLREYHNAAVTHAGDPTPDRIAAGGDILGLNLSMAKQTRIAAGRDIDDMIFVGQNLAASDITRIVAGRDITAQTVLETPVVKSASGFIGPSATVTLPAVQGNSFILGGPGALFIEAGRDAGPFLNSAVTNGYASPTGQSDVGTGVTTYGGGIITVGNLYNPALSSQGANIYTEFGVANGQNFAGLVTDYLDPAVSASAIAAGTLTVPADTPTLASLPGYLFTQTTDANGNQTPNRTASQEIYALSLVDWERSIAADVISRYDTTIGAATPPAGAPALIQFMEGLKAGGSATFAQALSYLPQLSDRIMPLDAWLLLNDPAAAALTNGGTQDLSFTQDMTAFNSLGTLSQREFLITDLYFNELIQTSVPSSPSYLVYSRGYEAVNTLFPGADGYTQNSLSGGAAGAGATVETGNLDLRLATIQTEEGGNIAILGPGGRVLAGSTVSTSVQASRRVYAGGLLYSGDQAGSPFTALITSIPAGYEGVLTLRGGSIDSFTDGDFLLNQSRAFTEEGGDIAIWSSNAGVNAGEGPRTTADVPPVEVRIDEDGYSQVSTTSAVSGAGIGAFQPDAQDLAPDVFLIAPRGTVDAGAAGVRSAGNVLIAAETVANADAIQAQGTISGAGGPAAVNVSAQTSGDAAASAAAQAAQAAAGQATPERPVIVVDVLGFLANESETCSEDDRKKGRCY